MVSIDSRCGLPDWASVMMLRVSPFENERMSINEAVTRKAINGAFPEMPFASKKLIVPADMITAIFVSQILTFGIKNTDVNRTRESRIIRR